VKLAVYFKLLGQLRYGVYNMSNPELSAIMVKED
jgi:hypothetical protein